MLLTLSRRLMGVGARGGPPRSLLLLLVVFGSLVPARGSYAVLPDDEVAQVPHEGEPPPSGEATLEPEAPFDPSAVTKVESVAGSAGVVQTLRGVASYYGNEFAGRRTASGERFDPAKLTAAHRTLPFGTRLRVTHLGNGRAVEVRVNDRGPYHGGRSLDLSYASARRIGMIGSGRARVRIDVLE